MQFKKHRQNFESVKYIYKNKISKHQKKNEDILSTEKEVGEEGGGGGEREGEITKRDLCYGKRVLSHQLH